MADSAGAKELSVSPTSRSQRLANSKTRQLNIADNSKVVNAATDGIQIREQNVDIAGAAKEINIDDRSNTRVTHNANNIAFHFSRGLLYDPRPYPNEDSGAFIYNRPDLIPGPWNYQPTWDETHEKFSDPEKMIRQKEDV